ncbi:MAG: NUDIX hydrolase [Anaerolineae bacterium]|nr:NUDIX hydrolase [Anaerolineae bacterium]
MHPWETLSRRIILDHSRYLIVESHDILLPDGRRIADWPWIITPDFVTVIVVNANGEFVLFRQTKYAVQGESLAPAGGYLEPGEFPLTAAKRELLEEVGYTSNNWTYLGSYPVDGNRGSGIAHIYLAVDAIPVCGDTPLPVSDDLEEQEIVLLSLAEVFQALMDQQFKVLPWVAAVSMALCHLGWQK